ncbi:hypothetical protein [Hoeflea sp.]|uniref:hypothetical protein n=1 Tax=Hoeflea sp. TaxID=1940281 RepID=UPI0025C0F4B4|nr:hypothetical protein [Hoeflea sp.]
MGVANFHGSDFTRIVELTPALRRRMEQTVEHLIALLDTYDGDPDAESTGDDEPWLGWPQQGIAALLSTSGDDRELEDENDEDGADDEPTIGWTENGFCGQTFDTDELEEDHEDGPAADEKHSDAFPTSLRSSWDGSGLYELQTTDDEAPVIYQVERAFSDDGREQYWAARMWDGYPLAPRECLNSDSPFVLRKVEG